MAESDVHAVLSDRWSFRSEERKVPKYLEQEKYYLW